MKVATSAQMKNIDRRTMESCGISGLDLMENAARAILLSIEKANPDLQSKSVLIFCGKGNNGGDGFALARLLYEKHIDTAVVAVAISDLGQDAMQNFEAAKNIGVKITNAQNFEQVTEIAHKADIIVDALLGTGVRNPVRDEYARLIEIINTSGKFVISVDLPSGISADNGIIGGWGIKANMTITLQLPKIGLLTYPAADFVGELIVADIGIPQEAILVEAIDINTIEREFVKANFPKRIANSNKGSFGKVFVIGGSYGYSGAPILATKAALRSGCGMVYTGVPYSICDILEIKSIESITIGLYENEGKLSLKCIDAILKHLLNMNCVLFGPGLGQSEDINIIAQKIIRTCTTPLIIDADGLNAISQNINILKEKKTDIIITPHPGEMARLLGKDISYINSNRIAVAKQFSDEYNVTVVLKGAHTVITSPHGETYINQNGSSALASAGTGDVLAGIIASLVAQGVSTATAAILGVYLHGAASDNAVQKYGEHGLIASDLLEYLPITIKRVL